jgi:hypothetical protein
MATASNSQAASQRPGETPQLGLVVDQASSPAVDGQRWYPVPAREADSTSDISPADPSGHNGDDKSDQGDSDHDNDDDDDGSDNESANSGDDNESHPSDHNLDSDGEPDYDKVRSEGFIKKEVSGRRTLISRWHSQKYVDANVMTELKDGLWEQLQTCIRDASFVLCPREMSLEMYDRHDAARLSWVVKDRAWLRLTTSNTLPFCMAWIWHLLYDHLFSRDCRDKWRKGPWSDFGALIQSLQGKVLTMSFLLSTPLAYHDFHTIQTRSLTKTTSSHFPSLPGSSSWPVDSSCITAPTRTLIDSRR